MTYQDIFVQILSEVSGETPARILEFVKTVKAAKPGGNWDIKLSDKDSEEIISKLRKDAPAIVRWLEEGRQKVAGYESKTVH
ncbi:MAG: hypothetical protein AB7U29_03590 [Desulfobulbus sp.]